MADPDKKEVEFDYDDAPPPADAFDYEDVIVPGGSKEDDPDAWRETSKGPVSTRTGRRGIDAEPMQQQGLYNVSESESRAAAAGYGMLKGYMHGGVDEVAGIIGSATPQGYEESRDTVREVGRTLENKHKIISAVADGIGTAAFYAEAPVAVGAKIFSKAGLAAAAKVGGLSGAAQGFLRSDAVGTQLAVDALKGGTVGALAQYGTQAAFAAGGAARTALAPTVKNAVGEIKLAYLARRGFDKQMISNVVTRMSRGESLDDAIHAAYKIKYKNVPDLEIVKQADRVVDSSYKSIAPILEELDTAARAQTTYVEAAERYIKTTFGSRGGAENAKRVKPVLAAIQKEIDAVAESGRASTLYDAADGLFAKSAAASDPLVKRMYAEASDIVTEGFVKQYGAKGAKAYGHLREARLHKMISEGTNSAIAKRADQGFLKKAYSVIDEAVVSLMSGKPELAQEAKKQLTDMSSRSKATKGMATKTIELLTSDSVGPNKKQLLLAALRKGPEALSIELFAETHGIGWTTRHNKEEKPSPYK